jgi:hypothetical protein
MYVQSGPMRGGSSGTSVRVPESQEGARESLKSPIALATEVWVFFLLFWEVFSTIFSLFRKIIM